ncbi:MAG: Sec-independent protein translocase protein TatB [Pseudomonadota bacterium]
MFDLGAAEILVIVIVAVIVIGPKDLPLAMRTAGRWIGKVRKVSAHFRTGLDAMVREAELEDMEKKWQAQNEAIMKRQSGAAAETAGEPVMTGPPPAKPRSVAPPAEADAPSAAAEAKTSAPAAPAVDGPGAEPELPLPSEADGKSIANPSGKSGE